MATDSRRRVRDPEGDPARLRDHPRREDVPARQRDADRPHAGNAHARRLPRAPARGGDDHLRDGLRERAEEGDVHQGGSVPAPHKARRVRSAPCAVEPAAESRTSRPSDRHFRGGVCGSACCPRTDAPRGGPSVLRTYSPSTLQRPATSQPCDAQPAPAQQPVAQPRQYPHQPGRPAVTLQPSVQQAQRPVTVAPAAAAATATCQADHYQPQQACRTTGHRCARPTIAMLPLRSREASPECVRKQGQHPSRPDDRP